MDSSHKHRHALWQRYRNHSISLPFFISVAILLFLLVVLPLFNYQISGIKSPVAQAATSNQLNFQGRLLTNTGGLVPDGNYHIEFKLYNQLAIDGGETLIQGSCTTNPGAVADEDCLWVETRTTGNLVTVRNGYFSVYLGDVTAFPVIDWSQDIFLGMNIGGSAGAASWDGEMTPRFKLTSVPYAFVSANVASSDTNAVSTNSDGVDISTGDALGATSNSGDISIDVGSATQTAGTINLGGANASAILFGNATSNPNFTFQGSGTFTIGSLDCTAGFANGGALTTNGSGVISCSDDDGGAGGITDLQGAYNGGNVIVLASNNALKIQDNATPITGNLFEVTSNAGATNFLSVSTTTINLGTDLIVAAGKFLTLNGGNTASRPGSPTEGMIYFDSDTDSLLTYANGKWQSDRGEFIVVAANDSTQSEKDSADYVADGTADQTEINNALTAAPGGKVLLLAGTYTANGSISIPNNTTLEGVGAGTVIRLSQSVDDNLIENTDQVNGTGIIVKNMTLDNTLSTAGNQSAIYFDYLGDDTATSLDYGGIVAGISVKGDFNRAIYIFNSASIKFSDNYIEEIVGSPGVLVSSSTLITITDNTFVDVAGQAAIYTSSSNRNTISGNIILRPTVGLFIGNSDENTITGNIIEDATGDGVTITNSATNTIANNVISNPGGDTNFTGISLENDSDANIVSGNRINDSTCNSTCYGIDITSNSNYNYISDNLINENDVDDVWSINDASSNTIYVGQSISGVGASIIFRQTNSTTAFAVQNAAGASILNIDTTNGEVELGNTTTAGKLVISDGSSNTGTILVQATSGDYTFTIPTVTANDTFCLATLGNCFGSGSGGTLQAAYNAGNTILATNANGDIDLTVSEATNFSVDITGTGSFQVQDSGTDVLLIADGGFSTFYKGLEVQTATSSSISGTAAISTGSDSVAGTSTSFTTELTIGDSVTINGETRVVVGIASDTSLTVNEVWTTTASSQIITKLQATLYVKNSSGTDSAIFSSNNLFVGNGVTNATASDFRLQATSGSGTNKTGGSLYIAGGQGTGNNSGGSIIFLTTQSGGGNDSQPNQLFTRLEISGDTGDVAIDTDTLYVDTSVDRVGIGTTAPAYKLDLRQSLNGALYSRLAYNTRNGGNDIAGIIIGNESNPTQFYLQTHRSGACGGTSATLGGCGSVNFNNTSDGDLAFLTNSTMRLVIDNSDNVYFGNGVTSATPSAFTLNATGGSGTDIAGANLTVAGGRGTGTGTGGSLLFQTATAGATGSSLNALTTRYTLNSAGLLQGSNGATISVPGAGLNSEAFGLGATAVASQTVAIGNGASAVTAGSIALGYNASAGTGVYNYGIAIGNGSSVGDGIAIGRNATGVSDSNSVIIGNSTNSTGRYEIVLGDGASTSGTNVNSGAVSIGSSASVTGNNGVSLGYASLASGSSVALGSNASASFGSSVAIGRSAASTASNQLVVGSSSYSINQGYFGNGVTNATPSAFTLNATGGSGTDIAGANLTVAGGRGTGTGTGGSLLFQTATAGASGASLNALTTRLTIDQAGASTFSGTLAVQGATATLGVASTTTGSAIFRNAGGAGGITLTPANPGASSYTLTLPTEDGTLCTTGSVCSGYQASGSYLTAEADTLATVTGRGATTTTASTFSTSLSTPILTSTAGLAVSTAAATNLTLNAGTTGLVQIGGTSTGNVELAGGSAGTGCTVTNATGALACTSTINGATISGGTISGGTLTGTAVNGITTANIVLTSGSYADPAWITSLAKSKVGLSNVENTALSTWAGSTSITTLGTISSGTWNGTAIGATYGGTGLNTSASTGVATVSAGTWSILASLSDAQVSDTLTVGSAGTVDWTALNNYPAACSAGTAVTTLGDTITCTAFAPATGGTGYIQLQGTTPGTAQTGNSNITGTAIAGSFSGSGSSLTNLSGGNITAGSVPNSALTNSSVTVTAGTGLTGGGSVSLGGSSTGLAVTYGSTANTAAQGNVTITCPSGSGNTTGGGTVITIGAGGTCSNITTVNNPTFTTSVTTPILTSTGSLAVSTAAATNLTLNAGTTGLVQIGATSTGNIELGGGSASTGCTVTNATGAFACTSTINGATISGGTISGGSLTGTAVNGITTANIVLTTGSYADPSWITSLAKSKVGLSNVENTALSTWAGSTSLTTLGTVGTGTWNGSIIGSPYGGTGINTSASTGVATVSAGTWSILASLSDAQVSDTLTSSLFVGSGSTSTAVDLATAEVNGTLGATNGGTGNAFTAFTGPASTVKTFTLPNASATILTTNAAVTVGQGGTGATTFTTNGVLYGNTTGALQVTAASTGANQCLITSGVGTAPIWGSCVAGGGVTTLSAIGATPNANGATITGNTLNLQPADGSFGGVVTTGTQTFAGAKTFTGAASFTAAGTGLSVTNNATVGGTLTVTSTATFNGNTVLGDATGDNITFTGRVNSSILPSANDTYDLGSDANRWANLYLGGETLHIGTSTSDEATLGYNTTTNNLSLGTTNGGVVVKNTADSTTALQVQNAAGASILSVDTSSTNNLISNNGFEVNTTGWAAKNSSSISRITSDHYSGVGALQIVSPGTANGGASFNYTLTASTQYTFSLYAKLASGTMTTAVIGHQDVSGVDIDCSAKTLSTVNWVRLVCTFTTGVTITSSNLYIKDTSNSHTFYIDGVQLEASEYSTAYNPGGKISLNGVVSGPVSFEDRISIGNAGGTNDRSPLFVTSTYNSLLSLGQEITDFTPESNRPFSNYTSLNPQATITTNVINSDSQVFIKSGNSQNITSSVYAAQNYIANYGTGTYSNLYGANNGANNYGANNITTMYGSQSFANNYGVSTITSMIGSLSRAGNYAAGTISYGFGLKSYYTNSSSGTTTYGDGAELAVHNSGTGTITNAAAGELTVDNTSSGNITNAYGANIKVNNTSTGNITDAYGTNIVVSNTSTGTVTNMTGVSVDLDKNAGTGNSTNVRGANFDLNVNGNATNINGVRSYITTSAVSTNVTGIDNNIYYSGTADNLYGNYNNVVVQGSADVGSAYGSSSQLWLQSSSATGQVAQGASNYVNASAGSYDHVGGTYSLTHFTGDTSISNIGYGTWGVLSIGSTATSVPGAPTLAGVYGTAANDSTLTVPELIGVGSLLQNNSTGTITSGKGFHNRDPVNSGTITNYYGYYSDYLNNSTNNYPLYFAGSSGSILQVTGEGATTIKANGGSVVALTVNNHTSTGNIFVAQDNGTPVFTIADGGNVGINSTNPSYPLDVTGNINSTTGYRFNGTAGATTTCSGGQFLQNQVVSGGITTGGTCIAAGSGTVTGTGSASRVAYWSAASVLTSSANFLYDGSTLAVTGQVTGSYFEAGYDCNVANSVCASNWVRTSGTTGWYNGTYAVGLYAVNSTELDTYGNADLDVNGGDLYVRSSGTAASITGASGNYTRIHHNGSAGYIDTGLGSLNLRPAGGVNAAVNVAAHFFVNPGFLAYAPQWKYTNTTGLANTSVCRDTSADGLGGYAIGHCSSLRKYKDNITAIPYGLETLRLFNPVKFKWNIDAKMWDTGFIAEEVEAINPIFAEYSNGILSGVRYGQLTAILTSAVQELDLKVQSNTSRLNQAESTLAVLTSTTTNLTKKNLTVTDTTTTVNLTVTGTTQLANLKVTGLTELATLRVTNGIEFGGKLTSEGEVPTIEVISTVTGDAISTTELVAEVSGTDVAGIIKLVSQNYGGDPYRLKLIFSNGYELTPVMTLTPNGRDGALLGSYIEDQALDAVYINFINNPEQGKTYQFNYQIIQTKPAVAGATTQ